MSQYPTCKHGHGDPNSPCLKCVEEDRSENDRKYIQTLRDENGEMAEELIELREAHGAALLMLGRADFTATQLRGRLEAAMALNLAKNAQEQQGAWMHEAGKLDGLCEMMQHSLKEDTVRIAELLDERDVAKAVLEELNLRLSSGYDFNADPDFVTLAVGCVLRGEPLPVGWAAGDGVWRCAPATEKEANEKLTDCVRERAP